MSDQILKPKRENEFFRSSHVYVYPSSNADDGGDVNKEENLIKTPRSLIYKSFVVSKEKDRLPTYDAEGDITRRPPLFVQATSYIGDGDNKTKIPNGFDLTIYQGEAVINGYYINIDFPGPEFESDDSLIDQDVGRGDLTIRIEDLHLSSIYDYINNRDISDPDENSPEEGGLSYYTTEDYKRIYDTYYRLASYKEVNGTYQRIEGKPSKSAHSASEIKMKEVSRYVVLHLLKDLTGNVRGDFVKRSVNEEGNVVNFRINQGVALSIMTGNEVNQRFKDPDHLVLAQLIFDKDGTIKEVVNDPNKYAYLDPDAIISEDGMTFKQWIQNYVTTQLGRLNKLTFVEFETSDDENSAERKRSELILTYDDLKVVRYDPENPVVYDENGNIIVDANENFNKTYSIDEMQRRTHVSSSKTPTVSSDERLIASIAPQVDSRDDGKGTHEIYPEDYREGKTAAVTENDNGTSRLLARADHNHGTRYIFSDKAIANDSGYTQIVGTKLRVKHDTTINGNLTVDKSAHVKIDLDVDGTGTIGKKLTVESQGADITGDTHIISGDLTVDIDSLVKGNSTVNGDSVVDKTSRVKEDFYVGTLGSEALHVNPTSFNSLFRGKVTISTSASGVKGDLEVANDADVGHDLNVGYNAYIDHDVIVKNAGRIYHTFIVGDPNDTSTLYVTDGTVPHAAASGVGATLNGYLTVNGGPVKVTKSGTSGGTIEAEGDISSKGNIYTTDSSGNSKAKLTNAGDLVLNGNGHIYNGTADSGSGITIKDTLVVTQKTTLNGNLEVQGSTSSGPLTVAGNVTINKKDDSSPGNLVVSNGAIRSKGRISTENNVSADGTISSYGDIFVKAPEGSSDPYRVVMTDDGKLVFWGKGEIYNNKPGTGISINSNLVVDPGESINSSTILKSSLTVQGAYATSLGGTLVVDGATDIKNTLTVGNHATSLGGTLTVGDGKKTTLGGALEVKGAAALKSTLTVSDGKKTTLGGALQVKGASTFGGGLTVTGDNLVTIGNSGDSPVIIGEGASLGSNSGISINSDSSKSDSVYGIRICKSATNYTHISNGLIKTTGSIAADGYVQGNNIHALQGLQIDSNYITFGTEDGKTIRLYVSATEPKGEIPDGSIGIGW